MHFRANLLRFKYGGNRRRVLGGRFWVTAPGFFTDDQHFLLLARMLKAELAFCLICVRVRIRRGHGRPRD